MRILVLNWRDISHPWAGGSEVNLHEQARRWVAAGHRVTLFCGAYPGGARREQVDGIDIVRRGGRFTVYLWAILYYLVTLRHHHDVLVDIENGIPFFTPLYSRLPKLCVAYHVHTEQFRQEFRPPLARLGIFLESVLMPRLYRQVRFVTISESSREELGRIGIPGERCTVINTGVDHARYTTGAVKSAQPTLLYLGRLMGYKRTAMLVEMMGRVLAHHPEARLDIVGIGPEEGPLRALVARRGLGRHVHLHGYLDEAEKVRRLQEAWLLATPSIKEGWGLVVIEANACGTPAVAFDVPGLRESIVDGETGFLAGSREEFERAVLRLLDDAPLRATLSAQGARHARGFSWERSADATLSLLCDLVSPVGQPALRVAALPEKE